MKQILYTILIAFLHHYHHVFCAHLEVNSVNGLSSQQPLLFSSVCQSGIREDNTNYIYCARRGLTEIPLFSKNNVVYDELVLSDNRITELNVDSFARIKVKKIYMNGNPLKKIDQMAFVKLENHLEELWLDADTTISANNFLMEPATNNGGIPKAILNYLRNLNTLKLKGFLIKQLENSILKKLNRIEILSLQFCSIEQIEPLAFDGLKNSLKELYLDGNLLQQIPINALLSVGFKSLKILSLSQNNIKTINSDSFGYLASGPFDFTSVLANNPLRYLIKLDLSYNGLKLIDAEAFSVLNNSLEMLLLQNNEINSFNLKFVRYLSSLKELNLDFNVISKFNPNTFINSNRLHYLTLQGNSIQFQDSNEDIGSSSGSTSQEIVRTVYSDYESVFNGLSSLQRLNLARNGVKHLPSNLFKPLTSLKSLILDKNPIENFDKLAFNGLESSLMNISLQNTKMKSKHLISLRNLVRLERVKLGFNDLDELDWNVFAKMHLTLSNLDLQNNQINSIYDSACELNAQPARECNNLMDNLIEFDLSNNKLCNFNSNLLNKMPKLKNLGLSQNPLYCDCNLLALFEWTTRKFEKDMLTFMQWQCELPTSDSLTTKTKRRQFTSLTPNDFQCLNNSFSSKCKSSNPKFISTTASTSSSSSFSPTTSIIATTSVASTLSSLQDEKSISRIVNVNLKSVQTSVLVSWELNNDDQTTDDIHGFKISYNQLYSPSETTTSSSLSSSPIVISFLTEKNQRQFKIENLKLNTHYSVCVSLIRYNHNNGFDKYCRDIELVKQLTNKLAANNQAQSSRIELNAPVVSSSSSPAITNLHGSNLLSGLMITVLSLMISFFLGLLVFFYFFIRKCRLNQKRRQMMRSKSLMTNSMNSSRRADYTGAILATSNPIVKNCQCPVNHPIKCESESSSSSNTSASASPSAICNCIRIGLNSAGCSTLARAFTIGDTSTVSSTLSSVNNTTNTSCNNNNNNNNMTIKDQFKRYKTNTLQQPNMATAVVMAPTDISASSPTSFTHYIIQQYNNGQQQQQPMAMSYVPYELYNCFQHSNQFSFNQQHQPQTTNNNINNNNNNTEHVYCEIPSSTLGRSATPKDEAHLLLNSNINNNNTNKMFYYNQMKNNLNSFHHFIPNNSNGQVINDFSQANFNLQHQLHSHNHSQQHQNTSTSLLISSSALSSNSSSSHTSPSQIITSNVNNNNNKFSNNMASII